MPANNASPTAIPAVNVRSRNSAGSTSGARPARLRRTWCAAKTASSPAPAASMPNVQAGQPSSRPSTSGNTSSARPVDTSTIPTGSGRGPSSARDSGSTAAARASAASPSGTLIRKIVRQPRPATSQAMSAPPRIGAPTTARPIVGPNAPNALPRSSGGNVALRMPKPCGISIAPSRPCATRKPISMPGEVARPHSADAATNPMSPRRNMRRRPYRSPRRPPVISPAAKASV